MNKIPKYWNLAKKYLSKKDKVMKILISKYSEKTILPETYAIKANVIATIITGTIAKPSKPSVKFTAFAEPTNINREITI